MRPISRLTLSSAACCVSLLTPLGMRGAERVPAHAVVMHLEAFNGQHVVVHIKSPTPGLQLLPLAGLHLQPDTVRKGELTFSPPADLRIGAEVTSLELSVDEDKSVQVRFGDGATDVEKRLRPWGRVLTFKRVDGNLQPSPKVFPVEPAEH